MLYLEDYLEMIEHLPQELRDRFTEMRELDLSVQNNIDELEKRVKILFSDCKRYSNDLPPSTDVEFQSILKEYYSTLEEADEKVHLANQMYELVDKYLRRLDTELHKFKCELEADNKGITELLEKRSLELDSPISTSVVASHQQKENRYESSYRYRPRSEKRRDNSANSTLNSSFSSEKRSSSAVTLVDGRHINASTANATGPPTQSTISYNLGHIGAGPAIAAAASQAIAATQQMQQGRRTASLKASYEAINTGVHVTEFGIGRELAGAAQTAIQAIQQDHHNNKKKQKKWSSGSSSAMNGGISGSVINSNSIGNMAGSSSNSSSSQIQAIMNNNSYNNSISNSSIGNSNSNSSHNSVSATNANTHSSSHGNGIVVATESPLVDTSSAQGGEVTDGEWSYDPNEPRYCLCNQVSYGDMVACDNEDCPSEWFHYPCVGITAPPKGKWYCPQCTASMRRRGGRKN